MKQPPLPQIAVDEDDFAIDGKTRDSAWLHHCAKLEAAVETTCARLLQRVGRGSFGRAASFPDRQLGEAPIRCWSLSVPFDASSGPRHQAMMAYDLIYATWHRFRCPSSFIQYWLRWFFRSMSHYSQKVE